MSREDGWTASFDPLTGTQLSVLLQPHDQRLELGGTTIAATRVAMDGKSIALVASDFRIHLWDASAGKLLSRIKAAPTNSIDVNTHLAWRLTEAVSSEPKRQVCVRSKRRQLGRG